jgi:hypothetical protein
MAPSTPSKRSQSQSQQALPNKRSKTTQSASEQTQKATKNDTESAPEQTGEAKKQDTGVRFDIISALPPECRIMIYEYIFDNAYFDPLMPYGRTEEYVDYECHYSNAQDTPGGSNNGLRKWDELHDTNYILYHRGNMPGLLSVTSGHRAAAFPIFMDWARWVFADTSSIPTLYRKMRAIPRSWLQHATRVLITQDFKGMITPTLMPNLKIVHYHMCYSRVNGSEGRIEYQVNVDHDRDFDRVMKEYEQVVGPLTQQQKMDDIWDVPNGRPMFMAHYLHHMQTATGPTYTILADVHVTYYDIMQMMISNDVSAIL